MFALVVLFPGHLGVAALGDGVQRESALCSDPVQVFLGDAGLSLGLGMYWLY